MRTTETKITVIAKEADTVCLNMAPATNRYYVYTQYELSQCTKNTRKWHNFDCALVFIGLTGIPNICIFNIRRYQVDQADIRTPANMTLTGLTFPIWHCISFSLICLIEKSCRNFRDFSKLNNRAETMCQLKHNGCFKSSVVGHRKARLVEFLTQAPLLKDYNETRHQHTCTRSTDSNPIKMIILPISFNKYLNCFSIA